MTPANHDLRAWLGEVEKIGQLRRIRLRAGGQRPNDIVGIVDIDIDDVPAEIGAGAALAGDQRGLLGVPRQSTR